MKILVLAALATLTATAQAPSNSLGATRHHFVGHKPKEWKKTVHIPPCGAGQNMEVIWPKHFHGTVTIECNNLPLPRGFSYR